MNIKGFGLLLLKPRQHLCYVYASLSRLDFRGLLEEGIVVFEGFTRFLAVKKPTALMMHWWNGGRGGVCAAGPNIDSARGYSLVQRLCGCGARAARACLSRGNSV